jgi:eukaryotic-like serine/threonine-protein kinase
MLEPGELIDGKYLVQRLIGRGGMGEVYEGQHTLVERRVAIKVVFDEVAASEHGASRFEREVRAAGRIGNDHILEIYDVGTLPSGSRYMVSEFLDGQELSTRLASQGPMHPRTIGMLMTQLLAGLAAAHQVGILHRDLKPDNIFLVREKAGQADFVKIIDFGISKFQSLSNAGESMKMTATGVVVGTPYYLSPEQARGLKDVDARSDLYAVGVIMYECATGRVPFHAESFNELIFKIALEDPAPLESLVPGIDPWFVGLVQKAMARDPAQRFQSAQEMRSELARWLGLSQSSGARPVQPGFDATVMADSGFTPSPMPRPRVPTPSSFGRTNEPGSGELLLPVRSRLPKALWFGAPLLLVIAASVLFIRSRLSDPATTDIATSAAPNAALAVSALPPMQRPAEPPPEPVVEAAPPVFPAPRELEPLGQVTGTQPAPRPLRGKPAPRPRANGSTARAEPTSPTAPAPVKVEETRPTAPPTSKPPARVESDRDFGY